MARIKKPKKLKLPKKPKASASIATMENYLKKVAQVKSDNAKRLRDYESAIKKKAALRERIARSK